MRAGGDPLFSLLHEPSKKGEDKSLYILRGWKSIKFVGSADSLLVGDEESVAPPRNGASHSVRAFPLQFGKQPPPQKIWVLKKRS